MAQLRAYARKRSIGIMFAEGVTVDNLYDAKAMVDEFQLHAKASGERLANDFASSPETGITLGMSWSRKLHFKKRRGHEKRRSS